MCQHDEDLVLLTLATTSFSESNWVMQATGPKISSWFAKISLIKNEMVLMLMLMLMLMLILMNLHAS